eukprot:3684109-Prymnesium_polylepis.1
MRRRSVGTQGDRRAVGAQANQVGSGSGFEQFRAHTLTLECRRKLPREECFHGANNNIISVSLSQGAAIAHLGIDVLVRCIQQ